TQLRSVSAVHPIFPAIDSIAAHCELCVPWCSSTIRTARSRTSGEYFTGLVMTPSSQELEPPGIPGRFRAPALQPLAKPEQLTESAARTAQAWASKSALPSSLKGDANVCVRGNRRGQGHAGGGHATERRAPGGAQHGGGSPGAGPVAAPVARGAGAAGGHWRL